MVACVLLVPTSLHAQGCGSVGKFASDVWDRYIEEAREAGCLTPVKGPRKYVACAIRSHANALHLVDRMVGWWNSMTKGGWATAGPRRLDPEWQEGTLRGTSGRLWMGTAPVNTGRATVEVQKLDGLVPADVVVCASRDDGSTREIARHRFEKGRSTIDEALTLEFPDLEAELLSVKVDGKGVVPVNRFEYRIRLTTEPRTFDLDPVTGFADLHVHQAANLGFGGNQLWGSHIGPISEALPDDGRATKLREEALAGPVQWTLGLHSLPGLVLEEGESRHGPGYPSFDRWPHFNDVTHQQVHEDWLKSAHERGLSLIVVSAVNFEGFCYGLKAMYPRPNDRMGCRDMENVERQIEAFIRMDEARDWYEIAVDPWHARQIIHDGKLAVVVSMEASHLLPPDEGDFVTQLDRLWGKGMRTLQLAHETDSRFAGAAPHRNLFEYFQAIKWPVGAAAGNALNVIRDDLDQALKGFRYDEEGKNAVGLRPPGRELVEAMIDRHMLIDVAHLSERSVENLHQLVATEHDYYPLYDSHTRFAAVLTDDDRETQQEFLATEEQIDYIRETGGMVGLRTGQNAILSAAGEDEAGVANDCDGSAKSFAQLVHYGRRNRVQMGLGSDFNGFINQLGPRYGDDACPRAGVRLTFDGDGDGVVDSGALDAPLDETGDPITDFRNVAGEVAEEQRDRQSDAERTEQCDAPEEGPGTGRDFDTEGLRHVGYLPDLVADLEALETPGVEVLKSSAEAFLRMWERAWDPNRTRIGDETDLPQEVVEDVPDWIPCDLSDDDEDGEGAAVASSGGGGGDGGGGDGGGGGDAGGGGGGGGGAPGGGPPGGGPPGGGPPGGGPPGGLPPGCPGCGHGDIHMKTLDDERYDLQAVGEFVLARSTAGHDLEVQLRLTPIRNRVSVGAAVAARIEGHRVGLRVDRTPPLRVDGEPVELAAGDSVALPGGGSVHRPRQRVYVARWPGGSSLHVLLLRRNLDVQLRPASPHRGALEGLLGDFDGRPEGDLRLADGQALARPTFETVHGPFADTWRITADASLFHYEEGESTATFTDRNFPRERTTVATLEPGTRAEAERVCREAGVAEAAALEACILDYALTGDPAFVTSALATAEGRPPEVLLDGPPEIGAGATFDVVWQGPDRERDLVGLYEPGAAHRDHVDHTYTHDGSPLEVRAPDRPGDYEIRYVSGEDGSILAATPLAVTPVTATLDGPAEIGAGSAFQVTWKGPDNERDLVGLYEPGSSNREHIDHTYTHNGSPLEIRAPDRPGTYELRYVTGQDGNTLDSAPLTVAAVTASLDGPEAVDAGSTFQVRWTGPDNERDLVGIYEPGSSNREHIDHTYTHNGSPLELTAPTEPGSYELRYVTGQDRLTLATATLVVR